MSITLLKKFTTPVLVGTLAIFAAGCGGDDPLEPEEHPEAGGVIILDESTGDLLAASIEANEPFDNPITVPVGGALEVEVLFLDEEDPTDLSRAFLPDVDEGESLRVTIADTGIATFEFHGDHGDFTGVSAGTTTATFFLMHAGHPDFTSGPLTIVIQ